jgi:hypothetical protein
MKEGDSILCEHDWRFVKWTSSSHRYAIVKCSKCEVDDLFMVDVHSNLIPIS